MGWGKTLAGVVAFAIGGTIAGAGILAASAAMSNAKKKEYNKGFEQAKAETASTMSKMETFVSHAEERLREHKELELLVISLFAVGISVANADGQISMEERRDLEEFITGSVWGNYPAAVKNAIEKFYKCPPNLQEAMSYVEFLEEVDWDVIDDLIDLVIESDGVPHPAKIAYREAWQQKRKAWATA